MKKITPILLALFLVASCSKEPNCNSSNGTVEIYSSDYSGATIYGTDTRIDLVLNNNTWTKFELAQGKYYIAYYNTVSDLKKDSFQLKACETVKLTY